MKLAFISTINSLEHISNLGDIEFCLAPYCLKYPEYKEYFVNQRKKGRYVILDNGIAENILISTEDMINLAIEMKVNEIIIPDKIGDCKHTQLQRQAILKKYYDVLCKNHIKIQSVIQGKTLYEYLQEVLTLEEDKRIDVIGIPFRIEYTNFNNTTKEENHMFNRLMFLYFVSIRKPIHLLGNNLPIELILVPSYVRSCDSKLMARYGFNNQVLKIDDIEKPRKKLFVNSKMTTNQINITIKNIMNISKRVNLIKR